jgi:chromate reductase, NAD(P)H dehydrogenase (quinone)
MRPFTTPDRHTDRLLDPNGHRTRHDVATVPALSGSSRRDSLNQRPLDQAALGAHAAGAEVTSIRLSDFELPGVHADCEAEHGVPKGAEALKVLVAGHQGLLIATPQHDGGYTALLKRSPGLLGAMKSQLSLQIVPGELAARVIPESFALGAAHQAFDGQGRLRDAHSEKAVQGVGAALAATAAKIATFDRASLVA